MKKTFLIIAGDRSGDMHAANLVTAIKESSSQIDILALGGDNLKTVADKFLYNLFSIEGFGFSSALFKYFALRKIFLKNIVANLDSGNVSAVILVDYYGFNIFVARAAKKRNIPVYYYICPQVWASRKGRINQLKKNVTKMLLTLPFERELYANAGINFTFVGHPIIDILPNENYAKLNQNESIVIGVFPGSRKNTVIKHIKLLENTAQEISKHINARFKLFLPDERCLSLLSKNSLLEPVIGSDYSARKGLSAALSVSGTVCLENSLLGIPSVIFYKLSKFNYLIAKMLVKTKFIAMPNILLGRHLLPELIQENATVHNLSKATLDILANKDNWQNTNKALLGLRGILGSGGVAKYAAKEILNDVLKGK